MLDGRSIEPPPFVSSPQKKVIVASGSEGRRAGVLPSSLAAHTSFAFLFLSLLHIRWVPVLSLIYLNTRSFVVEASIILSL